MILVTGGNGQLANCLKSFIKDAVYLSSNEFNITNEAQITKYFKKNMPQIVINCAAFTHVDKCESSKDLSFKVNSDGAGNLAAACYHFNSKLIHISTDYVFDGHKNTPYNEDDLTDPTSIYGKSKLSGEMKIKKSQCNHIIIRTSWLYSEFNSNFIKNILNLMKERHDLGIVYDQIGSPTYGMDLAFTISQILEGSKNINNETYHFANLGVASWYDLAKEIQDFFQINCSLKPIESFEYPTPAKRPSYSVLNTNKIRTTYNLEIPYWKESLKKCLKKLS